MRPSLHYSLPGNISGSYYIVVPPHSDDVDHALRTRRNSPRLGRHLPAADRPQLSAARRFPQMARLGHPEEPRADQGHRERRRRRDDVSRRRAEPLEPEAHVGRGRGRGGCAGTGHCDGDDGLVGRSGAAAFEEDDVEGPGGWGRERVRSTVMPSLIDHRAAQILAISLPGYVDPFPESGFGVSCADVSYLEGIERVDLYSPPSISLPKTSTVLSQRREQLFLLILVLFYTVPSSIPKDATTRIWNAGK